MDELVRATNARLKAAQVRVRILRRGDALYLQATLPPKAGEGRSRQRQIALGVPASYDGIRVAEARAFELSAMLAMGRFDWQAWDNQPGKRGDRWIVREAIAEFKRQYQRSHSLSEGSWERFWWEPAFRKLPPESDLTEGLVLATVALIPMNTWTRRQACEKLQKLCDWAGVPVNLKPYRGKVQPREIQPPAKDTVAEWYGRFKYLPWRRVYARIAIYGLRPHEAFYFERRGELEGRVTEGKTGAREVLAVFPQWARDWETEGELPNLTWQTYSDLGNRVTNQFRKYEIPFAPYDLRHAAAIEFSVVRGAPLKLAALQFGHSEEIHLKTYTKHLNSAQLRAAYDRIMGEG